MFNLIEKFSPINQWKKEERMTLSSIIYLFHTQKEICNNIAQWGIKRITKYKTWYKTNTNIKHLKSQLKIFESISATNLHNESYQKELKNQIKEIKKEIKIQINKLCQKDIEHKANYLNKLDDSTKMQKIKQILRNKYNIPLPNTITIKNNKIKKLLMHYQIISPKYLTNYKKTTSFLPSKKKLTLL